MTEQYSVAMVVATGVVTGVAAVAEVAIGTIGTGVATLAGASILLPVVGVFAGISYLAADFTADKSIKEEIEGAGLFNLAKLSDAEMNRAKDDARKIMAEIERNIKAKQQ